MTASTPVMGLPYLEPLDPPDIAGGLRALALAVEAAITAASVATAAEQSARRKYINKAADEAVGGTAFQDDNHFAGIAFDAGQVWQCEMYLELATTDATEAADFKSMWAVSGGAAIIARHTTGMPVAEGTSADGNVGLQVRDYNSSTSNMVDSSTTTRTSYRETLKVVTGAAGTITYQWAQVTALGTTTIKADSSWFTAQRLA